MERCLSVVGASREAVEYGLGVADTLWKRCEGG